MEALIHTAIVEKEKNKNYSREDFIKMFGTTNIDINDDDIKDRLINLYNKYVL